MNTRTAPTAAPQTAAAATATTDPTAGEARAPAKAKPPPDQYHGRGGLYQLKDGKRTRVSDAKGRHATA
jgi:hypothetical protein